MRYVSLCALGLLLVGCGGGNGGGGSPTGPAPTTSQTRAIHIDGLLDFGDVRVGESSERTLRVFNQGNAPMTVTSLTVPSGGGFAANWTSGTIAPNNGHQDILVRFSPTEARSYSGTFTVVANHTSGQNTRQIDARGVRDPFRRSGTGNTVFDLPPGITRMRIQGWYNGNSSNFVVYIGGRLVVNELVGRGWSQTHYDGTHLVSGTVVEIKLSSGVDWSFEEVQQ